MDFTPFKAIIWDLDGTIIDTRDLHFHSWSVAFAEHDIPFTEEKFLAAFGQNNRITVLFNDPEASEARIESIMSRKEEIFRQHLATGLVIFAEARALLDDFAARGITQVLATSAPEENIVAVFTASDLERFFEFAISGDALPPKPDPAIFILAANRLGVASSDCLVIEDSVAGVAAGKAAGMTVAAFTHSYSAEELNEADYLFDRRDHK